MKVLIVGCGAVGQVYGLGLQSAGVKLGLFDQPAVSEKLNQALNQDGLPLFQLTYTHRKTPYLHRLKDYRVLTDMSECQYFMPDQIWFTTPSQVYYSDWFRDFLEQVPSKRVVCFIPEGRRPEFFTEMMGDRLVFGGTTFMAWQGILDVSIEKLKGIYFWRSPLGIPLVGKQDACQDVAQILKEAGFRIQVEKPGSRSQAALTAVMTTFIAGLELSGWSLRDYRKRPWLKCAAGACREAVTGQLSRAGGLTRALLNGPVLSACFFLATFTLPILFPFSLEKYLKFHYTKTREQTIFLLKIYMKDCKNLRVPATNLQNLLTELLAAQQSYLT